MISDNSKGMYRVTGKSGGIEPNCSLPTGEPKIIERHYKLDDINFHQMSFIIVNAFANNSVKRLRVYGNSDLDDLVYRAVKVPRFVQPLCNKDKDDEISFDNIESTVDGDEKKIIKKITAIPLVGNNIFVKIFKQNKDTPLLTEL